MFFITSNLLTAKDQIYGKVLDWFPMKRMTGLILLLVRLALASWVGQVSCTRLRIRLNTISGKPGFTSLKTPLNHGAEQASNDNSETNITA